MQRRFGLRQLAVLTAAGVLGGCIAPVELDPADRPSPHIVTAAPPSRQERYCAWYGSRRGDVLYFGQAAFWSAMRESGGDPTADLRRSGPRAIGRFDLAAEALLDSLDVEAPESPSGHRSGVWDVLPLADGGVLFTTFFEDSGRVDGGGGALRSFPELGAGLNELAPGPEGGTLVTRYAGARGEPGAVLLLDPGGGVMEEWIVSAPPGFRAAPKTPAWDPHRDEIWVTTDLLPRDDRAGEAPRHDAYVIDRRSGSQRRIERPEIQFVRFGPDGTGYRAELDGSALRLRVVPPPGTEGAGRSVLLDPAFPGEFDFAQDIQLDRDGTAVVTRWSGWVHVVERGGEARSLRLPALDPTGLYYTAVLREGRICATHCADVSVVCVDAP